VCKSSETVLRLGLVVLVTIDRQADGTDASVSCNRLLLWSHVCLVPGFSTSGTRLKWGHEMILGGCELDSTIFQPLLRESKLNPHTDYN